MTRAVALVFAACMSMAALLASPAARAETGFVDADGNVKQTRPAKPNGVVEVEIIGGSLRIVAWARPEVSITGQVDGADLDISSSADRTRIRTIPTREHGEADLEIHVPRASRVETKVVSATVEVQGVVGALRIEGVSGDITATGAPSEVTVRNASGDVRLDVASASVSARSISGAVHVSGARGRIMVESVSGDCTSEGGDFTEVEMRSVSGEVVFAGGITGQGTFEYKTHSGRIELRVPVKTNADFELRTFSGSIESRLGAPRQGSSAVDFRSGNGGARVRARTFSGDIEIEGKR